MEQRHGVPESKLFGVITYCAVGRYLVMFNPLRSGNHGGVQSGRRSLAFHIEEFLAFLQQPLHSFAFFTLAAGVDCRHDLIEPFHMGPGLIEVLFERFF